MSADGACSLNYFITLLRKTGNNSREYRICSGTQHGFTVFSPPFLLAYIFIYLFCDFVG